MNAVFGIKNNNLNRQFYSNRVSSRVMVCMLAALCIKKRGIANKYCSLGIISAAGFGIGRRFHNTFENCQFAGLSESRIAVVSSSSVEIKATVSQELEVILRAQSVKLLLINLFKLCKYRKIRFCSDLFHVKWSAAAATNACVSVRA